MLNGLQAQQRKSNDGDQGNAKAVPRAQIHNPLAQSCCEQQPAAIITHMVHSAIVYA
jgi:hypothetical protein